MTQDDLHAENAALRALCKRALSLLRAYQAQTAPDPVSRVIVIDNRAVSETRTDTDRLFKSIPWS